MFQARKRVLAKKSTTGIRYWKNIGLGFRTPKEAIDGQCSSQTLPTSFSTIPSPLHLPTRCTSPHAVSNTIHYSFCSSPTRSVIF